MKTLTSSRPQRAHATGLPKDNAHSPFACSQNLFWTVASPTPMLCVQKHSTSRYSDSDTDGTMSSNPRQKPRSSSRMTGPVQPRPRGCTGYGSILWFGYSCFLVCSVIWRNEPVARWITRSSPTQTRIPGK